MRLREELPGLHAWAIKLVARVPGRLSCVLAAVGGTAPCGELERNSKQALLIIDDVGLEPLDALMRLGLLERLEHRHGRASNSMVSQLRCHPGTG